MRSSGQDLPLFPCVNSYRLRLFGQDPLRWQGAPQDSSSTFPRRCVSNPIVPSRMFDPPPGGRGCTTSWQRADFALPQCKTSVVRSGQKRIGVVYFIESHPLGVYKDQPIVFIEIPNQPFSVDISNARLQSHRHGAILNTTRINHTFPGTEKRSKVKTTMRRGFTSAGMVTLNTIDNSKCWQG